MAYTTIDDSSKQFQAQIYTGNGSTQSVTNSGNSDLQPDFVWGKRRNASENHWLANSSIANKFSNADRGNQESTFVSGFTYDSDGFSFGSSDSTWNASSSTYVAWQWKGNGGTTSTNTDGDIDTTVQVNSTAGFSIVTYSPPNATARTIGHGLGAIPRFIIIKNRSRSVGENWHVFHYSNGTGGSILDNSSLYNSDSTLGDALPTSTVYKLGTDYRMNGDFDYKAYFFANVQGFSKFGSYTGNGEQIDGPFVYLGFKPRFIIIRSNEGNGAAWYLFDGARRQYNHNGKVFFADTAMAEASDQSIDILSNGFKVTPHAEYGSGVGLESTNSNGKVIIYAAWAENPFVTSGGVPATAG